MYLQGKEMVPLPKQTSFKERIDSIMEKMTNSKALAFVLGMEGVDLPTEVREKLEKIKASIDKKNSGERKPTATQKANEGYKDCLLTFMKAHADEKYTVTDLQKSVAEVAELSNQKVNALVTQMINDGLVVRTEIKRKAYFSAVKVEE